MCIRSIRFLSLLFLLSGACSNVFAQISITGNTSFTKASVGAEFGALEVTNAPDSGGLLTFFVINQNAQQTSDSIAEVKISKNGTYSQPVVWWWPRKIEYNQLCAVQVKDMASPLAENDTVLVEVQTTKGFSASQLFINKTLALRLANIVPSQNRQVLYVYLRNDGVVSFLPEKFEFNSLSFLIGGSSNSLNVQSLDGWQPISAGAVAIYKFILPAPLAELAPMCVAVTAKNNGTQLSETVSSFQRLVNAEFPLGTWNSSLFNTGNKEGRKLLRQLPVSSVFGPGNFSLMQNALTEYKMRSVYEPSFDSSGVFSFATGALNVLARAEEPGLHFWNVDDEPDLNGKDLRQEILKNAAYWLNDTNTPSYINLAVKKKYQRYGFFADVVSMDHYSDDGPPNVIPFPWWYSTEGSVREAIEYTAQLKLNTEPKRMLSWCQLAANTWGANHQAEDYIVNFQFWSHIGWGAKGIHYFLATPDTKTDYPTQWAEAIHSTRQLNTFKNLCLYGESWGGVTVNSGAVLARGLVSEDALVIMVLNNSIDYTPVNVFNHDWEASITPVQYEVEFTVPDWIPLDQFYQATANGKTPIQSVTQVSGRRYRISAAINDKTHTFVIARNDAQAPEPPFELIWADIAAPNNATLSWKEPYDNFGVKGYYILADNKIIDSTRAPIWQMDQKFSACNYSNWQVAAFDDAGNLSAYGNAPSINIAGSGVITVTSQPADTNVIAGTQVIFSVADTGATFVNYQWQVDTGNGIFINLENNSNYYGVNTSNLQVRAMPYMNQYIFRCRFSIGCIPALQSNGATLVVTGSLGVEENAPLQFSVFPNPAIHQVIVEVPDLKPNTTVSVKNVDGINLLEVSLKNNRTYIDVANFAAGIYFIALQQNGYPSTTKKFIKFTQ